MKQQYKTWIERNVNPETGGYGECKDISHAMQKAFPELEIAKGVYYCPFWGMRTHWWLVGEDGTVVDPTAGQFPSKGSGLYEPLTEEQAKEVVPIGSCCNCGEPIYEGKGYCSILCTKECADAYAAYCNNPQ